MGVKKILDKSWAPAFRKLIFEKIDEKRYAGLYSEVASRTVYYNRKRLLEYETGTGCNLLEEEFKGITDDALKQLGVDTSARRMDSSFVGSFIKQMSRLEFLVKVLQNFYRDLPDEEKERWESLLAEYIEEEAEHISFRLRRSEVEEHLKRVGDLLFQLHEAYAESDKTNGLKSYQHVSRVLSEQFNVVRGKEKTTIEVKLAKEISASSLQNPADGEATFRRKAEEEHQGYLLNIAETCSPENPVQLLTDVAVYQNIASDEAILAERLPALKERTGVEEMIVDAGFTGEVSEKVCEGQGVELVPGKVKGRRVSKEKLSLRDFKFENGELISCPAD